MPWVGEGCPYPPPSVPGAIGLRAPPPARDNSCALSWFAMLSEFAIRALPRRAVLRWVTRLLCALVAIGAGAAVEAAAGARDDGVIGAPVCAQTGAAIASAAAIATPFKRCFIPLSSVAVPGQYAAKGSLKLESDPCRPWGRQRSCCSVPRYRSEEYTSELQS